ncbi:hypothetical protein [Frigoribacterium sp. PhB160]|uniref:hypothetical protein n=1 Tax=Frigoribacterium sp. PhB160 TaxID=2485192 RepID=UPI0011CDF4B6|nr:hypothetical protein [Frigoribacterium sp. PhB160]
MTSSTCATLAGVFPVLLLTVILEARNVHLGIRARSLFVYVMSAALGFGFFGLILAVLGVQLDGLRAPALAVFAWMCFVGIVLTAALFLLFLAASFDAEADEAAAHQAMVDKLSETRFGRLRLRWGAARTS